MRAVRGAMREMRAEETADASSVEGRERAFQQAEGETAGERAKRMEIWRERYTKYEKARIIGARALQIAMGAPILINTDKTDPIEIALEEFERGVIPITVRRRK
ncbi:MAG: DNA-directed RNA polymerase subunit K [Candidatus Methanospirare jalkutatii]|nr:DNA-directed RNA polymerase subunit K [Candidatus Methanospirare jalkutatii]